MHWVLILVMTKKLNLLPTIYVGVGARRGGGNFPIVHGLFVKLWANHDPALARL